jgi:hypothetical protein
MSPSLIQLYHPKSVLELLTRTDRRYMVITIQYSTTLVINVNETKEACCSICNCCLDDMDMLVDAGSIQGIKQD